MKDLTRIVSVAFILWSAAAFAQKQPEKGFHLKLVRSVELAKPQGNVDQLIELPSGELLVRDSTYNPLEAQAVEIYGSSGALVRKIGSYGQEPGHYYALKEIAFSRRQNTVWIADMMGRVSRFELSGKFLDSVLIQKPGFHPYGIALDEDHGRYYLTGCVALQFYLDLGCKMVHEYEIATNKYIGSFAENDPDAVKLKYFSVEDYQVSVTPSGLYAIDAPMRKFWRILPDRKVESFNVPGKALTEIPALDPTRPGPQLAQGQYLFQSISVDTRAVVISAAVKGGTNYLLEVFSLQGKPIALDITPPGRLLGKSDRGTLWFGQRHGTKFQIAEYSY